MEKKLNDVAAVLNQMAAEISHLTWNIALYNFAITALLLQITINTEE